MLELSQIPKQQERLMSSIDLFFENLPEAMCEDPSHVGDLMDDQIEALRIEFQQKLDEILHHPEFKALEACWLGLNRLVYPLEPGCNVKIDFLNVTKDELKADFIDSEKEVYSALYHHVYTQEYDTPGGEPYTLMMSDFDFDSSVEDVACLRSLSHIAASAHCPFVSSVSEKFFMQSSMTEVLKMKDLAGYLDAPEYKAWNQLRSESDARYLGLTLPRVLIREPYQHEVCEHYEDFAWSSAAFAFCENMIRAFVRDGWHINILGKSEGRVERLPYVQPHQLRIPTETIVPESNERQLSELGFIPLSYFQSDYFACFFSASSIYKEEDINARLPYILLSSRIAHYLKVLQRENIGKFKTAVLLEEELNRWLNNLITRMNNPNEDIMAKHPLKDGSISVEENPESPGYYKVSFYLVPHFQCEGMDIKLNLVSKLPK